MVKERGGVEQKWIKERASIGGEAGGEGGGMTGNEWG